MEPEIYIVRGNNVLFLTVELAFVSGNPCLFSHGAMELQKKRFVSGNSYLFSHGARELGSQLWCQENLVTVDLATEPQRYRTRFGVRQLMSI